MKRKRSLIKAELGGDSDQVCVFDANRCAADGAVRLDRDGHKA